MTMNKSLEFYNQFDTKLINDYALGNKRIISAIENLSAYLPQNPGSNVLDIGCGLGWSTFEFSRYLKQVRFEGIDLSPVLIQRANRLFQNSNLSFEVFDITQSLPSKQFDAIVMIDVYEHIPKIKRDDFHKSIEKLLTKNGRIILACPSVYHQEYLKKNNPEGLQPIDEDIDLTVLKSFANGIKGEIVYFEFKTIWRACDYFYAVIQKTEGRPLESPIKINDSTFNVEHQKLRIKRLKDQLDVTYELPRQKGWINKVVKRIKAKLK